MLLPKLGGLWLLPPRDFPHLNESHPMDHDSNSSGHATIKAWHPLYTPLADIYYFAPVPWHVFLFAFHGTALLLTFEETKKHFRCKGHALEFLG